MLPEYSLFNTGALFADDPTERTDRLFPQPAPSGNVQKPLHFTRANFADPATYTPASGFLRSRDIMELDPDPTGERTEAWGAKNGTRLSRNYVAGLNIFGRIMDRDKLVASEAGRQLLGIAEKNRSGDRRGFWDAITDFSFSDLPFVGMVASVGGSVSDAVSVFDTLKALQDGMPVSDENLIKTRLYLAKQDYDASGSWGATVGGIVRAAPGFMTEFALSGGLAAAGRAIAVDAGVGGTHLAMSRGAKVLARESVEHEAEKIVAQTVGKTAGRAAVAEGFAGLAGTASEREVVEATAKRLFGFMKSTDAAHLYKGFSDDALMAMANNRAQYEFGKMLSRRGGTALSNGFHSFTQWLGQNVSRGLLDFGSYGTEEATTLFTRQSTAGRALADALGVFTIEAPIKGGVLMLPKKAIEQGVIAPAFGQDGRIVSDNALSLRTTALMTRNRSLMDSAESIALGMDLLEYISENTGRGLKSLLAAGGIGLEKLGVKGLVRPAATAISAAGRELPSEGLEAVTVGGKMRQFVQKVFGSRADYAKRIAGQEAELVANRLGVEGAERAAVRSAVMSGNITGLRPELQRAIGSDLGKFVKETVSQAYDQGVKDLQYKSYARYAMAKWMQKHQVGPETVMNMFNQMGYDGVLGEMFEERYSDVVKGLLGLDARTDTVKFVPGAESSETASFLNNVKEAVKGLYPGWDQLTAEAVGFMFPMVTRGVAMRAMSAIGGQGELAELRSKLDVIDDAMRHNTVGEMTYADAQTAFEYARQADAKEVAGLRERLAEFDAAGDVEQAKAVRKELETREAVAARRAERQKVFFDSVDETAKNTADALIAVPFDTYGTLSDATLADRSPVLTAAEARQVLDAQKALGDFASQLARQIVEGQLPVEGESEGAFRKIARKLVGIAGFLATGDFSLAAVNPAQWTARDMGLSKNVVDSLRDGFRAELQHVRESSPDAATTKELLDETQRRFDRRARQIMSANLAVHQLRSFTDGRLTEEAAAQWAASTVDADGRAWHYSVDETGRGEFYKLTPDGSGIDEATVTSLDQMLRDHKADIEGVKRDIVKATVDIMTRRMTGADHGRNSVLAAMTLDRGSDLLDVAIYDAAMHMIGAQDLIYRVSLDGRTPLKAVLESRSVARVSDGVVDYIASKSKLDDVDARALESIAQSLRLRFDGTEGGLKARNEKIFRMAKLMRLNRREGSLFFSKEILGEDEEALRMSANGTSTLVANRQSDGTYTVDFGAKKDRPAERDIRTFGSVDELVSAMSVEGYTQDEAHTVLTQAKVIESSDMFWMIRELGLAKEYIDRLGDRANDQLHPMLRRDSRGKLLSQDDAEKLLREELAAAHRGVDAAAGTTDRRAYDRLFGEDGYMSVGEKLLADHGIRKDALQPYVGEFHDYAPSRYTYLMSAGRISPKSADTYVVIDPNIDSDITSGLVNANLLHAYSSHGGLLRDALGNVISDFIKDVRRAAKDALADAEAKKDVDLAAQLRTFLRTCCDDVDRIVRMNNGEMKIRRGIGLTPVGFTTLANAFGLFRAREDATNPMLRALATIAPQVWGSPSFLAFENVLNATLGGNFLDTAIWSAKPGAKDYVDPSLTGIPQVMALASADANALRNAVQSSLPAGLGYEQFLDAVLQQLTAQSKTASPAITEDEQRELRAKARAAAATNADAASHFTFLGGLVSTLKATIDRKVTTSATVTDFLASVLAAVEHDPNTTERQRSAAAKQLDYLRKRNEADTSEQAYLKKVEELSEVQKKLVAAQDEVKALRQRLVEMDQAALAGSARPEAGEQNARTEPAGMDQAAPAGPAVSESERQNVRTELADATAELEDFMSELAKKQEELSGVPAPEGVKALQVGGDTREDKVAQAAVEIEDFGDATVANDPLGQDVPEVFAQEASRREDGFLVEWGRATDDLNQRLTRRQAKLAASVVIRSLGPEVDEDSFAERMGKMFPHMSGAERTDVVQAFRGLDAERLAAGLAWDQVVISGSHFGFVEDDLSDEDTSSDNFNERALAEYNSESVKDFAALAKRVASETNGSVMGFVELLREQAVRLPAGTEANDLIRALLCPQLVPGLQSLAQADAHHKRALDRFDFGVDLAFGVDRVIAQVMESDPRIAFLLSYLSSLPVNARTRFAGLCAGSVAATPVHVTDGIMSAVGSAPDGKIPDTLVVDSVDALVGMTAHRLGKLADSLVAKAKGLALSSEGSTLDQLKHNAAAVAELFAEVFGRNNPLYTALTSGIAHAAWARAGEPVQKALLAAVSRSSRGVDAVNTIASAMKELASRGQDATRQDVESMFIAAFTMGGFSNPGLIRTPSRITHTDPLLGFLNMFQAALPRTMMKSEIDQSREQTRGSVVVAPRGMVPLLSRWLYQEGEGSFTDICRQTWKGVSDEVLAECRQNGTWPDDARTPVCAKCLSSSLTPREVYRACRDAYKENVTKWVPIYSGDHASFTLLQVPAEVDLREAEAGLTGAVYAGKEFVNHSGGALGSDSAWGDIGAKYGVKSNHYFKDKTPKGNVRITEDQYKEGLQKVEAAVGPLGRRIPRSKPYVMGLLSRNWQQVKNSDAVFAIANGFDDKGNVLGGTGWAVQMAKAEGKPIHVFNQATGEWTRWTGSEWEKEDTPILTKNFAGIGTRELNDAGRRAIESVYAATFNAPMPAETIMPSSEHPKDYKSFAKAAYKAIGMDLMFTDTKRSAISSLEAQGTGLVGVDAQGKYGEHRVHILHSWQPGTKNESFLGSTFMAGYGAKKIGAMSADPDSNTKKVHVVGGAGRDLFFIKSLTISQEGLNGKFREGSAPRAVFDYIEKFRGSDELSTDTVTDNDSYKIGPGNSKGLRVVNNGDSTVMDYVFNQLVSRLEDMGKIEVIGSQEALAKAFKRHYNKLTGDELDAAVGPLKVKDNARGTTAEMKLSEIMPGAMVNVFEGWSGPTLDFSYREDSAMAYTVANVAHNSRVPAEPGRSPRNYEIDALAMVRTLAEGGWLKTPQLADQFHELMANWGILSSAVYAHPQFRKALIRMDENLAELRRSGEFISSDGRFSGQFAVEEITRQMMAKVRQAANLPMRGIDAPLVAAGASIGKDGSLIAHTTSRMEAAMLKGSELFSDEERAFYGTDRRLALCNVNVSNNGFRYGWFLADDAEAKNPEAYRNVRAGLTGGRRHADAIRWAAEQVRRTTSDLAAADESNRDELRKKAADARLAFASMFVDHHDVSIANYGDRYLQTFGVEDLFMPTRDGAESFDYSAVQCEGRDLVFNDATGKEHVFLGGTAFGLPRTPSYNGAPWLQVVRAGLPVTEQEVPAPAGERNWLPGEDAMVSPDPYTNEILGCDHDGDKTKLYMYGVDGMGGTRFMVPPSIEDGVSFLGEDGEARRDDYLAACAGRGFLERVHVDDRGNEVSVGLDDVSPDSYYRISNNVRKLVSNSYVRLLFSMARQLPVDMDAQGRAVDPRECPGANDGRPRRRFFGHIGSPTTTAFPGGKAGEKQLLPKGLPSVIEDDGSKGTLGDPELAMEIATSAEDAGDARGVMVSLARTLHMAWAMGIYSGHFQKESEPASLLGPMTGTDWLKFMHLVDGLSNATFDDIKKQVCGRLGWTKGMMDCALTELLLWAKQIPTTEADFLRVLQTYATSISKGGSRYWMLRNSSVDDADAHRTVVGSLLSDVEKRMTKSSLMSVWGLVEVPLDDSKGTKLALDDAVEHRTVGNVFGEALLRECPKQAKSFLSFAVRDSGHDPAAALAYWAFVRALNDAGMQDRLSVEDVDGKKVYSFRSNDPLSAEDAKKLGQSVDKALRELKVDQWTKRRGLLLDARAVASSVTYLTADPGAPGAQSAKARAVEAFAKVKDSLGAGPVGAIPKSALVRMHEATMLMYDVGEDLYTSMSRAVAASENRDSLVQHAIMLKSEKALEAAGRLLAKDRVYSRDLMSLQANQQQVPVLAEFFTGAADDVLGQVGMSGASTYEVLKRFASNIAGDNSTARSIAAKMREAQVRAIREKRSAAQDLVAIRAGFTPPALAARAAVESMLAIMYELMVTSTEFAGNTENRAAGFLRMANDGAFQRRQAEYGAIAGEMRRVMPMFRANDQVSLDKVRDMFDRIILGQAFTGERVLAGPNARHTKAGSFTLSRATLLAYVRELTGGKSSPTTLEGIMRLAISDEAKNNVRRVWQALGDDSATVTPAVLFGALLPAYTLMTSRMTGVPNASSISLMTCLPARYYSALSSGEAHRRSSGDPIVPLMVGSDWSVGAFNPKKLDQLVQERDPEDYMLSEKDVVDVLESRRNELRGGAGLTESRRNPPRSNVVDIFDPAFETALGTLREGSSGVAQLPQATSADRLSNGGYDQNAAKLALAMGALLGSWAKVEYNGGTTFTIRGSLRGDAGSGKAVSIVVDTSANPLLDSEEDVEKLADSSAYAASLTAAVDLGMTAEDFLILPKEVRKALVRRFGVGGFTSSKVSWTVSAKGLATLVGKISVPAGGTAVYHEYFHSMMRMFESFGFFGQEDYAQLRETFGEDPSGRHKFNEEKAAEAFRKWVEGNTDAKAATARGVFQRILDFLKGLLETLKQGFGFGGDEGADTLFRMMVHGIAQPSSARLAEEKLEQAAAASEVRRRFTFPATGHHAARSALEQAAGQEGVSIDVPAVSELEELPNAAFVDEATLKRSDRLTGKLNAVLANPDASIDQIVMPLQRLAAVRREMAQTLGVAVDAPAAAKTPDLTVNTPADPVAENIVKVVSPLVNNNIFYRTANSIRESLEHGLRESGAWTDNLEYVVGRYSANDAQSEVDENLRRQSILHGLRRAMSQVNPAAAKSLSDKEIEDSLAYRAALVMHQHIGESFLNNRPAGRSPAVKEAARHASQYNVAAWIMSTKPQAPAELVSSARARIEELYNASPSGASKAELKMHLDQMDKLDELVGDHTKLSQWRRDQGMSTMNDVIGSLRAGTVDGGLDEHGNPRDLAPIDPVDADGNPTTLNPKSEEHLKTFQASHQDPAVQESLKLALATAYQLAAMAKYYGELDVHPALAGDIAESKRLARLNGIPEHMSSLEFLGEHLVGDSNLVDNPAYVDYQCQSHFIGQNVDAWLRSMVRGSFGAREGLGHMMSDEHFEYAGLVNEITLKENWIAHMLGVSLEPGGELLEVIRQKGEYRMENGEVVRKMGDEYVKFDNYGRKATSVRMTEDDIRRVDFWLKMCSAHANRQTQMVTGVDGVSFYRQLSRKAEDYSIDAVTAKRSRNERMNPVEWAVWRMTRQIPADLLPSVHRRFVDEALAAMSRADRAMDEGTPYRPGGAPMVYDAATYSSYVVGELVRRGVVVGYNPGESRHKGGLPRYEDAAVVISCDAVDAMFHNSETERKLLEAGRDAKWLDRNFICREFMSVWEDTARFVKRHPWLTHGDGQYFHTFGTALPFWRGSGIFMYNAVRTDRQSRVTLSDKMSAAEQLVDRVMRSPDADRPLAGMNPGAVMDDVDTLARFVGAPHRAAQFLEDVLAGKYEAGERDSVDTGLVLSSDATYGDLARAVYERARQLVWASRTGYAGSRHLEAENIIARYEDTRLTRGEVFGGSVGFKDTDMFRMHGTLPANYEIGHKVHKCIDGITNAMMSRATLANLLLTPEGSTGAPVYYADPNKLAAEASGLPDAFWGNLAEWWQAHNPEIGQAYDPAKSGVENAKAIYGAVREKFQIKGKPRKAQIGELGYTELGGDDSQLVSVDRWLVLDGNGEDFMNATAGGEAMGYLKHFLDAGKALGIGGAGVRAAIQRALSYSKSLSVSFSFFFPMATRWESPMGAVGAMSTIGSNWKKVGDWMKEHPDAANKIRGMFGGKAWITHDYLGMRDIVQMMDSNDPFLAEMYSWAAALGITVSTSVTNPMEPDKTVLFKDIRRMKEAVRSSMGAEAAGKFSRMMDAILVRQGDKAFNYVLNATKLAVAAQMCMKLRHQAKAMGQAFDPVRDLKKYSRYINAEIGGIDPMQFAWAHPKARSLMNMALFSWQWTLGAWQAGGGSVITDLLTGGHTMTNKERAYLAGRWMRMFLGVMIGVPALFQVVVLALAKAMGGGDDDDDHWGTWQNEDKARWSAFDLTPLLKAIARADETHLGGVLRRFKENGRIGSMIAGAVVGGAAGLSGGGNRLTALLGMAEGAGAGALAPSLVPLYTGNDAANKTTHRRRYYMHFGKQGWEFFRWFDDARGQMFSKQSMILQRLEEGIMGRSLGYLERSLPWDEMGQFERWLSPTTDSALFNIAEAFLPFSVGGMNRNGDAGVLPIFGPVQMGASQTATQKRLVAALEKWAANDRSGYRYGRRAVGKRTGKPYQPVTDILQDAERNGLDPQDQLDKACGQVMRKYYGKLFDELPDAPNVDYDTREVSRILRALNRLGSKKANALSALKDRYKTSGHEWKTLPLEQRQRVRDILGEGFANPFDY